MQTASTYIRGGCLLLFLPIVGYGIGTNLAVVLTACPSIDRSPIRRKIGFQAKRMHDALQDVSAGVALCAEMIRGLWVVVYTAASQKAQQQKKNDWQCSSPLL